MSRNENRSGLPDEAFMQDDSPAPLTGVAPGAPAPITPETTPAHEPAPAFNWAIPTEFVTLPSQGFFYPSGHPLHNQTTLEIRYMTAKEEDILTSKALLKEGIALDRMLQNLIVTPGVNVNDLLIGDKNALLIAARRTGYGADYTTNVTCPACSTTDEFTFDISDPPVNTYVQQIESREDVILTEHNTLVMTLPLSNVEVECRFLTGADELRLAQQAAKKSRKGKETSTTTDVFREYIVSVNRDPSVMLKETLIQNMPARDARFLRQTYSSMIPNVDMTQEYECTNCGHTADMEVPLSIDFFWPQ